MVYAHHYSKKSRGFVKVCIGCRNHVADDANREAIRKQIDALDKKIKQEKQPRVKRELYTQLSSLKKDLNE